MNPIKIGNCELYCGDCSVLFSQIKRKFDKVDCVVTDPPYGIGADQRALNRANIKSGNAKVAYGTYYGDTIWDTSRPDKSIFDSIRRVSKEQIIFGGNYFADYLPPSASWICWDKNNGSNDFTDFELAWTSHKKAARKVVWKWHGMIQQQQGKHKDNRIHPTQKPVGLMIWILERYTQPGDLILDPFAGSFTTGVACIRTGRRFIGIEREKSYFDKGIARIQAEVDRIKGSLFGKPILNQIDD